MTADDLARQSDGLIALLREWEELRALISSDIAYDRSKIRAFSFRDEIADIEFYIRIVMHHTEVLAREVRAANEKARLFVRDHELADAEWRP
jgi:hypothetical protein